MAKGFTLSVYPWIYIAKYQDGWTQQFIEQKHCNKNPHLSIFEKWGPFIVRSWQTRVWG